jgi:hypothetical protein
MDLICVASRGRNPENPKSRVAGLETEQQLEARKDGKTNCLTSVQKDNLVMQINPSTESGGKQPYQQNRVYDSNGISPALCANKADLIIKVGNIYPSGGENGNIFSTDGKSPTIKSGETSTKGNGGVGSCNSPKIIQIPEATAKGFTEIAPGECFDFENPNSETRRGRKMEDKSNCLMASETKFMQYTRDYRIRRLTPTECARLQTIPTWYKFKFVELYYFGYICSVTKNHIICHSNVVSIIATEIFQIRTQDFVTCTTLDLLEKEQLMQNLKFKKIKNVKLKAATEQHKQCNTEMYALCTIKDFIDINLGKTQLNKVCKNVNIVIEKLEEVEDLGCAQVIIEVTKSMAIHLRLKTDEKKQKTDLTLMDILDVRIKKKDTNLSWKIQLGENLNQEKLCITLTLLNWIIERKIYTYAKDNLNIHLSTGNWNVSEQNCINVELSDLRMESIISSSDTQQYRMLGNGWTIEVISHILSYIKTNQ